MAMTHSTPCTTVQESVERDLAANAAQLARLNIVVHVDAVSPSRHAVFCSVEQLHHGWLWHTCTVEELAWRAEQALAPLMIMGILPMVTVKHPLLHNSSATTPQGVALLMHWLGRSIGWAGIPWGRRHGHRAGEAVDPFGWRAVLVNGAQEGLPSDGGEPAQVPRSASQQVLASGGIQERDAALRMA